MFSLELQDFFVMETLHKLVRKMCSQIFRRIVQKFRRQTACLARDFWAI